MADGNGSGSGSRGSTTTSTSAGLLRATLREVDSRGVWLDCSAGSGSSSSSSSRVCGRGVGVVLRIRIAVVECHVVRVLFVRKKCGPRQPRTWAIVSPSRAESSTDSSAYNGSEPFFPANDCPWEGYDRLNIPFPEPSPPIEVVTSEPDVARVRTSALQLVVHLNPLRMEWWTADGKRRIARDRPSRPYAFGRGWGGSGSRSGSSGGFWFSHAMERHEDDVYMGLGDKTGDVNLHGRRLRIATRDALGYCPKSGDPLYKHWPFLLVRSGKPHPPPPPSSSSLSSSSSPHASSSSSPLCYGLLYDNMAEATFDLGCEHSNYFGRYRTYCADDGDLDLYFIAGPTPADVVSRKLRLLTGGTALPPRWSLGFHCTAMPLADAADAQQQMEKFIAAAVKSQVPCSAFHFGSGYTSIGKRRYVFHWNRSKFPDPKALVAKFNASGMRVVANVKPCLLTDHPSYAALAAMGAFVSEEVEDDGDHDDDDKDGGSSGGGGGGDGREGGGRSDGGRSAHVVSEVGVIGGSETQKQQQQEEEKEEGQQQGQQRQRWRQPAVSQFWDGDGSHVDFTNPNAVKWWQEGVQLALLDVGIDAAWNDNNEYEISSEFAASDNSGCPLPLSLSRPLHALLMTRASYEQQLKHRPAERPYSVTRAGFFGTQRYAQTWTGDNATGWDSLRWNLRTGLSLSLSGHFNLGHDVGGFSGPAPGPELLVRWVQAGLLHPRFIMNSWKDDGMVTTPWMHPPVLPLVRWAIRLRYRLLPSLYSLLVRCSLAHEPFVAPTFFHYPEDEGCWRPNDEMLLGRFLLAAPVVEEGARQRSVYLPKTRWQAGAGCEGPPGGWFDFYTEEFFPAGQRVTVAAPLDRVPLFAAAGAVIPMMEALTDFSGLHDDPSRVLRVFPPPPPTAFPCASSGIFYEDDGISRQGSMCEVEVFLEADDVHVSVEIEIRGDHDLPYQEIAISVPRADTRELNLLVHDKRLTNCMKLPIAAVVKPFVWHPL